MLLFSKTAFTKLVHTSSIPYPFIFKQLLNAKRSSFYNYCPFLRQIIFNEAMKLNCSFLLHLLWYQKVNMEDLRLVLQLFIWHPSYNDGKTIKSIADNSLNTSSLRPAKSTQSSKPRSNTVFNLFCNEPTQLTSKRISI